MERLTAFLDLIRWEGGSHGFLVLALHDVLGFLGEFGTEFVVWLCWAGWAAAVVVGEECVAHDDDGDDRLEDVRKITCLVTDSGMLETSSI